MADTNLQIVINAKDEASNVLRGVAKTSTSIFADITKAAVGFGIAGGIAFAGFTAASVKAADESEKVLAQLGAVLKSTGGIAGVTSQAAVDLSKALQKQTTFSDEAVLSAENLLLTFTKIGKDQFPDATKAVLDMSTALGQDTKSSAIQLGKALQDPILGITALRRVGVNFSDKQKDVIKNLVETGHSLEAQKMILKEINTEFGGSAAAATKTFGGALKQLNNSVNDLMETFGLAVINAINPFVKALAEWATSDQATELMQNLIKTFQRFTEVVGEFVRRAGPVVIQVFQFLKPAIQGLVDALGPLWQAFRRLWTAIQPLLPVIGALLLVALYATIVALTLLVQGVTFVINKLLDFANFIGQVGTSLTNFAAYVSNNWNKFWTEDIPRMLGQAYGFILGKVAEFIVEFVTLPQRIGQAVWDNREALFSLGRKFIEGYIDIFSQGIAKIIQFFKDLPKKAVGVMKAEFKVLGNFAGGATEGFRKALGFAHGGFVPGPVGSPQLAVVHGGEKILNPAMQDVNNTNVGGVTININGNFTLDSEERVNELAVRINKVLANQSKQARLGLY